MAKAIDMTGWTMRDHNVENSNVKVLNLAETKIHYSNSERKSSIRYWNCECLNCGRKDVIVFGDYLRNGDTTSCGCILSKNESKIADMLHNAGISFRQQYMFDDLTSTGRKCDRLLFDFAVMNGETLLYLIEYDG